MPKIDDNLKREETTFRTSWPELVSAVVRYI